MASTTGAVTFPKSSIVGVWDKGQGRLMRGNGALRDALMSIGKPFWMVQDEDGLAVAEGGSIVVGSGISSVQGKPAVAYCPAVALESLGDPGFCASHGVRYAYVAGAMAKGITSEAMVEEMSKAGMLSFFGAAGLPLPRVEAAIDRLERSLGDLAYGFNLIHSPNEPLLEKSIAELYIKRKIKRVSASAYLVITPPLVRYRLAGIHRDAEGKVVVPNKVVAKVSRIEVARRFFSPPPEKILSTLQEEGFLSAEQVEMARSVPIAEDLTAEADSGGHTDNRPALTLVPTMLALRDEMQKRYGERFKLRVGAAGGIATPMSACAAFSLGAAYILTGTVNQACVESGTSDLVRQMLAEASQGDVTMAPAADMFEMGVQVQVLKRGTLFHARARKLYELYRSYPSLDALPDASKKMLEKNYFRCTLEEEWANTKEFFAKRDPSQLVKAERDPRHKMALVFRSYLGRASVWANQGIADRKGDFQIWCGPAIGAFNEWVKGSFLEKVENRKVVTVALNLLFGAAYFTRLHILRSQGVSVPAQVSHLEPLEAGKIRRFIAG